ncbi:SDR family NAD(P)-dependent oxidoreductase [Agrobacterium vitis]|uniref:SDR family NAD(P)-dependent oxidoreductase n=1 Tax=Agrobacterium vitis TaxID=373 RepID=UPI0015DA36A5|nr:SDR family NAD(P)-dependent oxidoreductase [Agrobacterium vitis]MCF1455653.1 SDR family NAD(P)-dependent oxidoreductase [Agrobacterium vitis]BCH57154.1 hypothetical protein RvVAR031_pl04850 [Agrobacterium vitis]
MTKHPSELLSQANPLGDLDRWVAKVLLMQLRKLGVFGDDDVEPRRVDDLRRKAGVLDHYARWWTECCMDILETAGLVRHEGDEVYRIGTEPFDDRAVAAGWEARKALYLEEPQARAVVMLLDECLQHLPDILRGKVAATDIIFPNASLKKVEGIYKNNERSDYFNLKLAEAARTYLGLLLAERPDARVRILEIGAGTGGTTATVLPQLDAFKAHIGEYCYTDVSNAFLIHGRTEYGRDRPFLTTRLLNVEEPPAVQGAELGVYDMVIATNVLHATKNIGETLRNTKALLKKNGILLLNELIEKTAIGTLTFGLLDGWWRYEDDALRIPGSPLLNVAGWKSALSEEGFGAIFIPEEKAERLGQQVLVAESDGVIRQKIAKAMPATAPAAPQARPQTVQQPSPAKERVKAASDPSKRDVEARVLAALADALKVEEDQLKADVAFADYGVDSILGVTFVNSLQQSLGIELNAAIIFDHSTVERLSKYVLQQHRAEIEALFATPQEPESPLETLTAEPAFVEQAVPATVKAEPVIAVSPPPVPAKADDIAVIGMAGQFPEAEDVERFWHNLITGVDGVVELPEDYLDRERYFDKIRQPGKTYCQWGGILRQRAAFDPLFFALSPREAESMNPHQRLILQESWKALEDAGHNPKALSDQQVGMFIGAEPIRYASKNFTGASEALVASRLSYSLNLKGPALVVNTGCSSSAVALHLACESLRSGETDLALAGGVHAGLDHLALVSTSEIEMLSPRGRCRTLDASGDGTVLSEGVGMVVLKRLGDAIAGRDHVYGVIKASGTNQDGASNGITAPNGAAQEELITRVYRRFDIDPAEIDYVELHGTGTRLGDPVEANALVRAFKAFTDAQGYCGFGSAKSHIGHTSAAAGVIGLIKVLLSMRYQQLPGLLHFKDLNPLIDLKGSAFHVVTENRPWRGGMGKRRMAALNSFGHSGTNAHFVIADYPEPPVEDAKGPFLVPLSAASAGQLKAYAAKLEDVIARGSVQEQDLPRIAYTFQTGREPLRHRVAFVAATLSDLKAQLGHLIRGEALDGVIVADIKALPDHLKALPSGEDAEEMIGLWLKKRDLNKLAKMWVAGHPLDWALLHDGPHPHRLPLPTYPFAQDIYWRPAVTEPVPAEAIPAKQHPLLQTDRSEPGRPAFRSRFSGREFFLADHTVQGRIILPGVAHLELVRAAVERASGPRQPGEMVRLENIVWIQPIVVNDPKEIEIVLSPGEGHRYAFEIFSHDGGRRISHCQGRAEKVQDAAPASLDPQAIMAEMQPSGIEMQDFYAAFRKAGIIHGPSYLGVTALYRRSDDVMARLVLPEVVATTEQDYGLHPSLMESALQAASLLIAGRKPHEGGPSLPFALESLSIHGASSRDMYAWVRYVPHSQPDAKVVKLNIDLIDGAGLVVARLENFSFRRISDDAAAAPEPAVTPQRFSFGPTSHAMPASPNEAAPSYAERHILLRGLPDAALSVLKTAIPQARFAMLPVATGQVAEDYTRQALTCFARIQSILSERPQGKVLFQIVLHEDEYAGIAAGVGALLKTAALEYPAFSGQILVASPDATGADLARQLDDAAKLPHEVMFSARQGELLVRSWKETGKPHASAPIPFKNDGRYLITGGATGIGLIFAQHILQNTRNARVILTGRSALDGEREAAILTLGGDMGRLVYEQADVADAAKLRAVIARHDPFDGILHSAGIHDDDLIGKKTAAGFERVLAAKVQGTVNLDLATRDHDLDFLVLFSSISAVLGNPGQADYATGNAFMDGFAAWRNERAREGQRRGHTLSLNWPLWEAGGMVVSETGKALMRQSMGAVPLPSAEGLAVFAEALALGASQAMVLYGDPEKIRKFALRRFEPQTVARAEVPVNNKSAAPAPGLVDSLGAIQRLLADEVAAAIQLSADKLEMDVEFSQYGFDSIVLMDFVRDLNQKYGLELMPTVFFEYSTIATLAAHLDRTFRDVLARHLAPEAVPAPEPVQPLPVRIEMPVIANPAAESGKDIVSPEMAGRYRDIAIIGMDGLFPEAQSVEDFWQAIRSGKDLIKEIPQDHWDYRPWYDENREGQNTTYCKWGSFVDGVDRFDAAFFNISPVEAEWMDPQMRLFLQSVYRTAEDAGRINEVRGSKTGVFVGVCSHDYMDRIAERAGPIHPHQGVGTAQTVIANRVSFLLNLTGPSLSFNTACSASLVALHEACHSLQRGECSMAFVGGVNLLLSSHHYRYFSSIGALSPTGRCYSFDGRADGYVPGETIASILLKPLAEAERDGDRIYAVIKGSAALHGGFTPSITAPSVSGEKNVIVSAWKNAGIDPSTLGYIEAHGTGTKLGDPIEVSALTQAFQDFTPQTGFCALGSAKAHLGHTEGSAGIVGVIKVVQQMRHGEIPAMPFYEAPNPYLQLEKSALYINRQTMPWQRREGKPRRAGVSSFGFSGVYAHVVLEEYRDADTRPVATPQRPHLIVLSAKNEDRLKARIAALLAFLSHDTSASLSDIAYTLQVGREAMKSRLAFVAASRADLLETLRAVSADGPQPQTVFRGEALGRVADRTARADETTIDRLIADWQAPDAASSLLRLWVQGQSLDWNRLYNGAVKPRRIALPLYPFGGERHWFEPAPMPVTARPVVTAAQPEARALATPVSSFAETGDGTRQVLSQLTALVAETTKIPAPRIDPEADFEELGLDSILISALNKKLEALTGVSDSTLFFKYKTLSSLAGFLDSRYGERFHSEGSSPAATRPAPAVGAIREVAARPAVPAPSRPQPAGDEDIAIIGMSGRYPGAPDLESFWDNLCRGVDSITEIPAERFDYRPLYSPEKGAPGSLYCKWGGFIDGADQFDAGFFKLSPQDARFMDPQERLFLETAWQCLESAGQVRGNWQREARNIGVFAGVTFNNYQLIMAEAAEAEGESAYLANSQTFSVANRVSYLFNFTGPSFTVDTACSSSLMAIHLACESLKRGECDAAIAGGVNLSLHPSKYITLCATGFAASDGRCHAFAANGDGYVPSEGVGAVLLKPYSKALADGDPILAIVKGTGVSHDGKTRGYTVPNPVAQSKAIEAALRQARISPEEISYVEAHGTGTALGDPIEIQGLMDVYSRATDRKQYCAIGSVKSNIGHGESAAGIAQITKTVLQLQHKTLVPSLLHDVPNPAIDFAGTAFHLQRDLANWRQPRVNGVPVPRYAGISSFGAGGVNVHVILGEAPVHAGADLQSDGARDPSGRPGPMVFPLSAPQKGQLAAMAQQLHDWLLDPLKAELQLEEVALTLQTRRALFAHRLAFVASDRAELCATLAAYAAQGEGAAKTAITPLWYEAPPEGHGMGLDLSTEEDRDYLQRLLAKGRADKLAIFWVQGAQIPWEALYAGRAAPRCAPLPTYPFRRKRYWVGGEPKAIATPPRAASEKVMDRLMHEAVFDVTWCDVPLMDAGGEPLARLESILVIAEDDAVLQARHWGTAGLRRCRIGGDPAGDYDVQVDAETLDFTGLDIKGRAFSGLDAMVYVAVLREDGASESLEAQVRHEGRKLQAWLGFILKNIEHMPRRLVLLSVLKDGQEDPVHALLGKYVSFLRSEYPELQVSIIRVDDLAEASLSRVQAEIGTLTGEMEIVFRNGVRRVPRFVPLSLPQQQAAFDASGCMVITGGFGGIGYKLLQWLIEKGLREAVVIGRKPLTHPFEHPDLDKPLTLQALIERFAAQGVKVHYLQADVGKTESLDRTFAALRENLGHPITAVFHLAGTTTNAIPLSTMTDAVLMDVVRPKALGAYALDQITADDPLRYFCLFSSNSAVEGMQVSGLAAYGAANAALDALAAERKARGKPVQLVHWTDWDGAGMAVAHGHKAFMEAVGVRMLEPLSGLALLEAVLTGNVATSTVFDIDWKRFSEVNGFIRRMPFFETFVEVMDARQAKALPPQADILEEVDQAPALKAPSAKPIGDRQKLLDHLSGKLAGLLEVESVSQDENLSALGLDSINSLSYFKALSAELSLDISPSVTFRYPTLARLADYLSDKLAKKEGGAPPASGQAGAGVAEQLQAALRRSGQLLNLTA